VGSFIPLRDKKDDTPQSDRWGIFFVHWAPIVFAIGLALTREEK
jgi:hypothetical protein